MRKTVASKEQGARSKERRAKSEERGDLRNEKRRTPNVQPRNHLATLAKVTGDPEVCGIAGAAKR